MVQCGDKIAEPYVLYLMFPVASAGNSGIGIGIGIVLERLV